MGAAPNPAQALGVQQYLKKVGVATPVINVPGCPVNPEWVVALIVDVVLMKDMDPRLNPSDPREHAHLQPDHP